MPEPLWPADTEQDRAKEHKTKTLKPRGTPPEETPEEKIQRVRRIPAEQKIINAFLNASGQEREAGTNTVNDPPCYAIIGRGFAATVDHATLVQSTEWSKERLGKLPVVHIGFADPWRSYHPHNMNQELELLTLPGYANQPGESDAGVVPDEDGELPMASIHFFCQDQPKRDRQAGYRACQQRIDFLDQELVQRSTGAGACRLGRHDRKASQRTELRNHRSRKPHQGACGQDRYLHGAGAEPD